MRIRRATSWDLSTTATFSVPAFIRDELYQFTNPFAARYPDDFRRYYLRKHRQRNVLAGYVFWVATLDSASVPEEREVEHMGAQVHDARMKHDSDEKVVGYAIWRRYGKSEEAKRWQSQTWAEWLESSLLQLEEGYISFFGLDRSTSASRVRSLQTMGFSTDEFDGIPERWHLQNLCVNPVYQGKGIGAKLVSWGLEQATKEAVAVTLSTSTVAEPLYRRMGFNTWTVRDYPGIRMGTPSLVYWPAGVEVVATREN